MAEKTMVTPAMAQDMLFHAAPNRNVRHRLVEAYARDMKGGNWRYTGEAIKFDADGQLVDGQHRLRAVLKSGASVEMLVVRDIAPEAMAVMDTGASRPHSDQLKLRGVEGVTATSAIAGRIWLWDRGYFLRGSKTKPTHSELDRMLTDEPLIEFFGALVTTKSRRPPSVPASVAGAAAVLFCRLDKEKGLQFWDRWVDGTSLSPGSPILALRNLATRSDRRLTPDEWMAYACSAWNIWRDARMVSWLRLPHGGLTNANFPVPR